jgi:hypothetical protein
MASNMKGRPAGLSEIMMETSLLIYVKHGALRDIIPDIVIVGEISAYRDDLAVDTANFTSNSPTYFAPLLKQDQADMPGLNQTHHPTSRHVLPKIVGPETQVSELIRHYRSGGDTKTAAEGPPVKNDFHTLSDDSEGSGQEQDINYDHDDTADIGTVGHCCATSLVNVPEGFEPNGRQARSDLQDTYTDVATPAVNKIFGTVIAHRLAFLLPLDLS